MFSPLIELFMQALGETALMVAASSLATLVLERDEFKFAHILSSGSS
jgi:hypothetical protein